MDMRYDIHTCNNNIYFEQVKYMKYMLYIIRLFQFPLM